MTTKKNKIIKFNHNYFKLKKPFYEQMYPIAKLIQVLKVNSKELSEDFLKYDTSYYGGNYTIDKDKDYLLLILLTPTGSIVTTLRNYTTDKEEYYKCCVGDHFDIYINKTPIKKKDG